MRQRLAGEKLRRDLGASLMSFPPPAFHHAQGQEQAQKRSAHAENHGARFTAPSAKSRIWSNRLKIGQRLRLPVVAISLACDDFARYASENKLTPEHKADHRRRHLAARSADARQPSDKNKLPMRKIPRNIPPTVPASSAPV